MLLPKSIIATVLVAVLSSQSLKEAVDEKNFLSPDKRVSEEENAG